jgi:hypothetical protein
MKKAVPGILVLCGLLALGLAASALASGAVRGDAPAIKVSPHVIVLARVKTITVHTNIPYSEVDTSSLELNGCSPTFTKADNRGELVAKFRAADFELARGNETLTLTGDLEDGTFFASEVVRVK